MSSQSVTVIGAGLAGAACARALADAGVRVALVDRGRAPGGRMASPEMHGRRVDKGAAYFTVRDDGFAELVERWRGAGLVHEWTDTFGVLSPGEAPSTTTGPMRWGTPDGLRSLVRDVLGDLTVTTRHVDELPDGDVVLAMPDPQAGRIRPVPGAVDFDPTIAVVCGFDPADVDAFRDGLPFSDAAFVNDHPDVSLIADDGARRRDGAPVLVVHTTAKRAAGCLEQPDLAIAPAVAALQELCDLGEPAWTVAHRWSVAQPAAAHDATHHLTEDGGRLIGFAGDQWCPDGSPRIESAWRSGTDLAAAILAH